jgi:sec-independent protein translocase protein TatA
VFDIGTGEVLVILVLALLLFGGSLPDVARNLGRTVGEFKRDFTESTRPVRDVRDGIAREVKEIGEEPRKDEPKA